MYGSTIYINKRKKKKREAKVDRVRNIKEEQLTLWPLLIG